MRFRYRSARLLWEHRCTGATPVRHVPSCPESRRIPSKQNKRLRHL